MGVPCRLDSRGVVEVVKLELSEQERSALLKSAKAIKGTIELL